jgi:hypothetical protein
VGAAFTAAGAVLAFLLIAGRTSQARARVDQPAVETS